MVSTEWVSPLSFLSTPIWAYWFAALLLHPVGEAFLVAVGALLTIVGLVHLQIPLTLFVFGEAGCCDQGGIDDPGLSQSHVVGLEMGCDYLTDLYAEIALPQQVLERENRGLTRNLVFDHVDSCKAGHRRHDDQRMLHRWIVELILLPRKMDSHHDREPIGWAFTLGAGFGIREHDQVIQCFVLQDPLNRNQKLLPLVAILGRDLLIIAESALLVIYISTF